MRIDLVAVGRLKAGPERDLCARYAERFRAAGKPLGLDGPRLVELPESAARRDADRKAEEARALGEASREAAIRLVLDERAPSLSSEEFAALLVRWRDSGRGALAIVIGGADGLDPAFVAGAEKALSFGRLTLPHQLVRVLVLEQLYRAATLLSGHPYHRP